MQIFLRIAPALGLTLALLMPPESIDVEGLHHLARAEMSAARREAARTSDSSPHPVDAAVNGADAALQDRGRRAIALLLRALEQPDVQSVDVVMAWDAAELEATAHVDDATLMAVMWPESRYQPTAGPACGVMQVYPHDIGLDDASSCALWRRDVRAGVRAGVSEIETMLADHRVHNLREALLYRACGNKAFTGECPMGGWVDQVFARRAYLVGSQRPRV